MDRRLFVVCSLGLLCVLWVGVSDSSFLRLAKTLKGPYCERRPVGNQCCPGRDDKCSMPILGTKCYCDLFCNNTADDCCPDFWDYCLGIEPPTKAPPKPLKHGCLKDGKGYQPGETHKDNCNTCSCDPSDPHGVKHEWRCTQHRCAIESDRMDWVNDGHYGWNSQNYSIFWGKTLEEAKKYRLGTFQTERQVMRMSPLRVRVGEVLPESFDSRLKWPDFIHPVRDQGDCGSSWAFSSVGIASDRLSIETNGQIKEELSVQNLISCHRRKQNGCEGGHLDRAWYFLRKRGVVKDSCYPYVSGKSDVAGKCKISYRSRSRTGTCPSGSGSYKILFKTTPPYRIAPKEREIMREIETNGPVQATFQVKGDFFSYQGGVYKYSNSNTHGHNAIVGWHSVKIIGWGSERSPSGEIVKYWICENSWGPRWGEKGYFRISRNSNECEIESFIVGAFGRVTGDRELMRILSRARSRRLGHRRGSRRNRKRN